MRLARFQNSIKYEEIEVAANTCRSEAEALPQGDSCRRAIFQHRASDSLAGA
jgi:hypothetical protein